MKKVKNILLLLTALFTLGCSQTIVFEDVQTPTPTPTPKPEPEPDLDTSSYVDLSSEGTANCYLVKAAGKYKLKAVKGNSTQSVGAASSATVLWESFGTSTKPNEGDLIASATYKDGYVYFATPTTFKSGNASIAVRDSNAKILWSWHIWLSKEGWNDHVYANNAGTMMDRNLGATSATPGDVGAFGLLYQWGRKDPFLGSGATSGTTIAESTGAWNIVTVKQSIDYTIENPMTFIGGTSEWCSIEDVLDYARRWYSSVKTMHDPCPVGYRVPDGGETGFWATAHTGSTWDSTNKGRNWSLPDGTTAWYPATGYRDLGIGSLRTVGYSGDYWSASPYPSDPYSYLLSFGEGDSNIVTANRINRGFGYSVRCVSTTENPKPDPESMPANNEIWYTSTDGKVVTPAGTGYFNVSITSNTYSNGRGVITFSGPITTVGRDEGDEPFANCANLKSVVLPNGLKTIGYGAFSLCSGLESVTIPETVTVIQRVAFYDCDKLKSITLPYYILTIGNQAFASCDLVESVTIPDSVIEIGGNAFSGEKLTTFDGKYASNDKKLIVVNKTVICAALGGLTEYSIPNAVEKIGFSAFNGYKNIKKFTIPNSVVSIGEGSFSYCTSLQDITIPVSVTEIVGGSFYNCTSLTSAILSKNLTKIGDATFMNCSKLKNIYCSAVTPPQCGKDLFEGVTTDFKIYVPASSVSAYKSASGWSTYADAIVADPASTPDLDYSTATDLSAEGTANCYLVKAAGTYKYKAVKGNSTQSVGAASSADVLWESFGTSTTPNVGDLIASATYKDGYVYFATPTTFKSGNASIAVRDSNAKILWSWHIWLSKEGWNDHIYANNAGTMMDRNLGATSATPGSVGALGLMYQWGRKDPFLSSSSISSNTLAVSTGAWSSVTTQQTVDYATANPMTFVRQNSEWCTGDGAENSNYTKRWTESEKTMYDPCPVGYRVPDGGENGFWATALGTSDYTDIGTTWDSTNKGRHWTLSDGTAAWYPAVGFRSYGSGALIYVGSDGYCWSASPDPGSSSRAYSLNFLNGYVTPASFNSRSSGCSVRCVSTTATSEPTPGITSAPYAVGDYYNDGTKEGVVFEVSADGTSGKIVSMMQSTGTLQWSSDETEQKRLIGADSETDGAYNTAKVKAISGWETKYPAFKWCADLGDGWYLPAKEELLTIYNNIDKLNTNLTNKLSTGYYWSSTEDDYQDSNGYFCAWDVYVGSGRTYNDYKYGLNYVRAVSAF